MTHVVLVTNAPTPYRLPLFNEVERQFRRSGKRLTVLFAVRGYERRKWDIDFDDCDFAFEILNSRSWSVGGQTERTAFVYSGLLRALRRLQPDAVIVSGFSLGTVKVAMFQQFRRTPFVVWSGSVGGRAGSGRGMQRRWLARRAAGGISYGKTARDYLVTLGIPADKVAIAINTVDTEFFREAGRRRSEPVPGEKQRLLYLGYLSPRKNVGGMLSGLLPLIRERDDFVIDLVGDGADRENLQGFVVNAGIEDRVIFHGYRQKQELPPFMQRSRALLFPTRSDVWGLVLIEAMAAGLPCVASPNAVATTEIIDDRNNGFVVDFDDEIMLVDSVRFLLDNPQEADRVGRAAADHIAENVNLKVSASGFDTAIRLALETKLKTSVGVF